MSPAQQQLEITVSEPTREVRHVLEISGKDFCGREKAEASRTQMIASSARKNNGCGKSRESGLGMGAAELRAPNGRKYCFDVRVFDTNAPAEKGISVREHASLDKATDRILYAGWYD